jgi:hypothetical protein
MKYNGQTRGQYIATVLKSFRDFPGVMHTQSFLICIVDSMNSYWPITGEHEPFTLEELNKYLSLL